jgi:hypothetical protein
MPSLDAESVCGSRFSFVISDAMRSIITGQCSRSAIRNRVNFAMAIAD